MRAARLASALFVAGIVACQAIYATASEQRIIILHAFMKKTQRTPKAAIDTAISRMKELRP